MNLSEQSHMKTGLQVLFEKQEELQIEAYQLDPANLGDEERAEFIRWNMLALFSELNEALDEIGWKPWANSRHINTEALTNELADVLHFFANICLATGVDPGHLAAAYRLKRERNLERQIEGYSGVKEKCPHCKRDYKESQCTKEGERTICQDWESK